MKTPSKFDCDLLKLGIYTEILINDENREQYKNEEEYINSQGYHYIIDKHNLSEEDIKLRLSIHQSKSLNSIKGMLIFFTTLTVISLCLSVIVAVINN